MTLSGDKEEGGRRSDRLDLHAGNKDLPKAGQSETIRHLLHKRTGAAESRARDVLADKNVNEDTDDLLKRLVLSSERRSLAEGVTKTHDEDTGDDALGQEHRSRVELGLAHLRDDAKAA